MENNVIELAFDKATTRIGGYPLGEDIYKKQVKDKIDFNKLNIIVFPQQIIKVASSFTQGFFKDIISEIGYEGIENCIKIQSNHDYLAEDIMADIFR